MRDVHLIPSTSSNNDYRCPSYSVIFMVVSLLIYIIFSIFKII